MINRAAILLKYKEPSVDWINTTNSRDDQTVTTLDEANHERTVYLISNDDADHPDLLKKWIKLNYKAVFEHELMSWYTDPELWPQKRTYKLFNQWFDVECNTVIEDTVGSPIFDDD